MLNIFHYRTGSNQAMAINEEQSILGLNMTVWQLWSRSTTHDHGRFTSQQRLQLFRFFIDEDQVIHFISNGMLVVILLPLPQEHWRCDSRLDAAADEGLPPGVSGLARRVL